MGNIISLLGGLLGNKAAAPEAAEKPVAQVPAVAPEINASQRETRREGNVNLLQAPAPTVNQQRAASIATFLDTLTRQLTELKVSAGKSSENPNVTEATLTSLLSQIQKITSDSVSQWISSLTGNQSSTSTVQQTPAQAELIRMFQSPNPNDPNNAGIEAMFRDLLSQESQPAAAPVAPTVTATPAISAPPPMIANLGAAGTAGPTGTTGGGLDALLQQLTQPAAAPAAAKV